MKNALRRIARPNLHFRACCVILALGGISSSAFASVEYVRDIPLPASIGDSLSASVLASSQSPFDAQGTNALPYVTSPSSYSALDLNTGEFGFALLFPTVWRSQSTVQSWVGESSTGPNLVFYQSLRLITYNVLTDSVTSLVFTTGDFDTPYALAALSLDAPISLLASEKHFTADRLTGATAERPLVGVDMASARFMSYGADGHLYVLDYGNGRIASFDPDDAFAPISSFNLNTDPGTITANEQFAIGINGSFYLSDGTGGGSYYNSLGVFQGVFNTGEISGASYTGQSYINTDASGAIIVYDAGTGIHQYQDTSVTPVPEPSTYAVAFGAVLGALILLRRRSQRA